MRRVQAFEMIAAAVAGVLIGNGLADIIPADRKVEWSLAGIPGGIPHYTNEFARLVPSDDVSGATDVLPLNAAVLGSTDLSVIQLETGTYYVNDQTDWSGNLNGRVLRGRGPHRTKIIEVSYPARQYLRGFSFDEDLLSVQTDLAVDAAFGTSTITPTNMPAWIVPNALIGIDQVDVETNGVTDFGQEGNSSYRPILGHERLIIDDFTNVDNWTAGGLATISWFSDTPPGEAGQSQPGVLKMVCNFASTNVPQTATATVTLSAAVNMQLDYTRIYAWYKIDGGSALTAGGDYGTFQFSLLDGPGLTNKAGESGVLESRGTAGWLRRNMAAHSLENHAADVRKIVLTVSGSNFTGPVTLYIDAVKLVGGRGQVNVLKVSSVTSSNFTTELPMYEDWRTDRHAQIFRLEATPGQHLKNCGIEDLSLEARYDASGVDHIVGEIAENCWIKNVHMHNSPGRSLNSYWVFSYRCEVRDCFSETSHEYGAGQAYGIALYHGCMNFLVENNIVTNYHTGLSINFGCAGNVFGYNYGFGPRADSAQTPFISTHGTHTFLNLFEGNWGETKTLGDVTHGSSGKNTLFRNRLQGYNYGRQFDQAAVSLEMNNRHWNIVGNVLGVPGVHTNYSIGPDASYTINTNSYCDQEIKSIFELGFFFNYGCSPLYGYDNAATMDAIIHGNWDAATAGVTWDGSIADHVLPTSLYLSGKPSWWDDGAPWPPIDPLTTTTNNIAAITIPAKLRYEREWVPPTYSRVRALGSPLGNSF